MPSSLAEIRRSATERARRAAALGGERVEEVVRGPWLGYVPDIEPGLVPYNAMVGSSSGLFARGELLVPDLGWARVDPTRLPLGDDGAGVGSTAAFRTQAIQHLGFFNRQPSLENELIVVTQDEGGGAENSNVFRLPLDTVTWSTVPPRGGYAAPALPGGFGQWSLGADDFVDEAVLSSGFNLTSTSGSFYADAAGRGVVGQPIYFFVNESNLVAAWPCFRVATVTEYDYPIEAIGTIVNFRAATCEALEGRMCYGNITTSTGTFPQRMWFSAIGDGAAISPGVVGAGFKDATEMSGRLLRLRRIGDSLAGYFESGIVLYQRTFNPLDPFNLVYLTTQVNVVGKRAVCTIDRDRHFVIAEQGWFLLDSNGQLVELGLLQTGTGTVRKWLDTFYANLNAEKLEHVSCVYDPTIDAVQISFPSRDSDVADMVWLYDHNLDRVFPMADFGVQAIQSQVVANSIVSAALTWDTVPGTWATILGTWASYSARRGYRTRYHGDRTGRVYVRSEAKGFAREGVSGSNVQPPYAYVSPKRPIISPAEWAEANRIEAEYVNVLGTSISLGVNVDGRTVTGARSAQAVPDGESGVAYVAIANVGGTHHQFSISGTSPVALRGFRYVVTPVKGERKAYQT